MMEDVPPQKLQELTNRIAELTEKNKELSGRSKLLQQGKLSYLASRLPPPFSSSFPFSSSYFTYPIP
jgi:hypothetical protein